MTASRPLTVAAPERPAVRSEFRGTFSGDLNGTCDVVSEPLNLVPQRPAAAHGLTQIGAWVSGQDDEGDRVGEQHEPYAAQHSPPRV